MMTPPSGSASPAMRRSSEVLPVPLPPMTPMMAPLVGVGVGVRVRVRVRGRVGVGVGVRVRVRVRVRS